MRKQKDLTRDNIISRHHATGAKRWDNIIDLGYGQDFRATIALITKYQNVFGG